MYENDKRFSVLEKRFLKAFENFDIAFLQKCLDAGMDINAIFFEMTKQGF